MPAAEWKAGAGGLFVPDDNKAKATARINEAIKLTLAFLNNNGVSLAADRQALGPEVFRLICHEGLAE